MLLSRVVTRTLHWKSNVLATLGDHTSSKISSDLLGTNKTQSSVIIWWKLLCSFHRYSLFAQSGEWILCFNLFVPLACNVWRLMYAQLRLGDLVPTRYALQWAHIWARDRGSPHNGITMQKRVDKKTHTAYTPLHNGICQQWAHTLGYSASWRY